MAEIDHHPEQTADQKVPFLTVFWTFLKLGLTSFGGPVAHLGYFREEFVNNRKWLDDRTYADLVALCQFLPGPASSQVGIGVGLSKGGFLGAVAAWIGFTFPSAVIMILFGYGVMFSDNAIPSGMLQGLKLVAVAVVAQAVWGMAKSLCPDRSRASVAVLASIGVLMMPSALMQVGVIILGGLFGFIFLKSDQAADNNKLNIRIPRSVGMFLLVSFFVALFGLPILAEIYPSQTLSLIDSFYRAGSLVFGGGHVVLPLLQSEVVPTGWMNNDVFLAGYGAAQAVPGPLFTFAAYLGTVMTGEPNGVYGGIICLLAIFASSFLLVIGVLPYWDNLRRLSGMQSALMGVNAAVVGLLMAALYHPVWTSAVFRSMDLCLVLLAYIGLVFWKIPPWLMVILSALAGWVLSI